MSRPPTGTPIGTLHELDNRGTREVFEWTGTGRSTPKTGWATKASFMAALGWNYIGKAGEVEVDG